ncbi:glycosyltransferase family 4 protein [Salinihabitans flavidus]|uniref:glycosyltransferase family 4 protein n=1 Tax=Salinihabitans flavidus TaxID=569882 RepID=UPI001FDFDE6C|nr:glycosyltransferase family 1 protein [Salinihabitans flavidus]
MSRDLTGHAASDPKPARIIDLSRLIRRTGRRPTGVDRVELAYLRFVIGRAEPAFGLVRTRLGYVLLDRAGLRDLLARFTGAQEWGPADRLARAMRIDPGQRRAESDLRRLCTARCLPSGLKRMLRRNLPRGAVYYNVGHSNLTRRVLRALKDGAQASIVVFLHDTIPLDHPQYQRPESEPRLRKILHQVSVHADLLLCNSEATRTNLIRHLGAEGRVPPVYAAHLGVDLDCSENGNNATVPHISAPYFLCLGTIEPRKNHAFLLDLWDRMAAERGVEDLPHLVICGRRGWCAPAFFERLDSNPLRGRVIHEFGGLSDGAVRGLLRNARGLLFPSLAEGFGLPPVEAAALGIPVICNDLPVLREILGDIPIYATVSDSYLWERKIRDLTEETRSRSGPCSRTGFSAPRWEDHFKTVLSVT